MLFSSVVFCHIIVNFSCWFVTYLGLIQEAQTYHVSGAVFCWELSKFTRDLTVTGRKTRIEKRLKSEIFKVRRQLARQNGQHFMSDVEDGNTSVNTGTYFISVTILNLLQVAYGLVCHNGLLSYTINRCYIYGSSMTYTEVSYTPSSTQQWFEPMTSRS